MGRISRFVLRAVTIAVLVFIFIPYARIKGTILKTRKSVAKHASSPRSCAYLDPSRKLEPADLPPYPPVWPTGYRGTAEQPLSLYVTIVSGRRMDEWRDFWGSRESFLLSEPQLRHQLVVVPERDSRPFEDWVLSREWQKTRDFSESEASLDSCEGGAQDQSSSPLNGWYTTPRGATVAVQLRRFRRPTWMLNISDAQLGAKCGPLSCCYDDVPLDYPCSPANAPSFSLEHVPGAYDYAMLTVAYTYHILVDTTLLDKYDYVFKLDADIGFMGAPPEDMGASMAARNCSFAHTAVLGVSQPPCWNRFWPVMQSFSDSRGMSVASGHRPWCDRERGWTQYFYSNWVGGAVPWLRAPATKAFLHHMYETSRSLWCSFDQGAWFALLCMTRDVDELDGGRYGAPHLCTFRSWRDSTFAHY